MNYISKELIANALDSRRITIALVEGVRELEPQNPKYMNTGRKSRWLVYWRTRTNS